MIVNFVLLTSFLTSIFANEIHQHQTKVVSELIAEGKDGKKNLGSSSPHKLLHSTKNLKPASTRLVDKGFNKYNMEEKIAKVFAEKAKVPTAEEIQQFESKKKTRVLTQRWLTSTWSNNGQAEAVIGMLTEVCVPNPDGDQIQASVLTCEPSSDDDPNYVRVWRAAHTTQDCGLDPATYDYAYFPTDPTEELSFVCTDVAIGAFSFDGLPDGTLYTEYATDSCALTNLVRYYLLISGCFSFDYDEESKWSIYTYCINDRAYQKVFDTNSICYGEFCDYGSYELGNFCNALTDDESDDEDDILPDNSNGLYESSQCIGTNGDLGFTDSGFANRECHYGDITVAEQLEGIHYGWCDQVAYSNRKGTKAYCLNPVNKHQDSVLSYWYTAVYHNGRYRYATGTGTGVDKETLHTYAPYKSGWVDYSVTENDDGTACVSTSDGANYRVDYWDGRYRETGLYDLASNSAESYGCYADGTFFCSEDGGLYSYVCRETKYKTYKKARVGF